ncbi:MAG: alpha/beta hydrolase [Acidimicrobiales bacterium]
MDCVVHTAVGVKCRDCTGGAAATAPTATARARASKADRATKKKWPVPVAVAGVVVLLIAAFAITRGGGDSSSTTDETGGTAAATGAGAEPSGESNGVFTDKKADFVGAGGLKIGATLTVPDSAVSRGAQGVLIIPGGGAQNRNGGVQFDTGLDDPLYQDLSEALAGAGIVSLRYDKRGTGQSQLAQGAPLSWDDLVADAKAGLDFLAARRETQNKPITVMGYDQGGFVALQLAGTDTRVKGVVLISTPGRPIAEVIASDFARGIPDQEKAAAVSAQMRDAAAAVVATGEVPKADTLPGELKPIFSADPKYLRGLFGFDPVAAAAKVKQPTLLFRGGNDGSILPSELDKLKASLANATVMTSPLGSNTLSLPAGQEGRFHNPARHGTTRDGDATAAISDWINANVKG